MPLMGLGVKNWDPISTVCVKLTDYQLGKWPYKLPTPDFLKTNPTSTKISLHDKQVPTNTNRKKKRKNKTKYQQQLSNNITIKNSLPYNKEISQKPATRPYIDHG